MTTRTIGKTTQLPQELKPKTKVEEAPERLFDAARDSRLIAQCSHFFCLGCLVARPTESRSYDLRYCQRCCDLLETEAVTQPSSKSPQWRPRRPDRGGQNHTSSENGIGNLSAVKKRGRQAIELPGTVIIGLIADGIPRKEIARRMGVSTRTLRRKIKGGKL
jgi:hypothetical protein